MYGFPSWKEVGDLFRARAQHRVDGIPMVGKAERYGYHNISSRAHQIGAGASERLRIDEMLQYVAAQQQAGLLLCHAGAHNRVKNIAGNVYAIIWLQIAMNYPQAELFEWSDKVTMVVGLLHLAKTSGGGANVETRIARP